MTIKLRSAKIKNFKSLGDVDLKFKDLTILVGANSSGKSNSLEALRFLRTLLVAELPVPVELMQKLSRFNNDNICYEIVVEDEEKKAEYSISMTSNEETTLISREYLKIDGIEIINIVNGEGKVTDEDGENHQIYQADPESEGLALRSAGNFGNKPFTKKLASYIKEWKFYDVDPGIVRRYPNTIGRLAKDTSKRHQGSNIMPSLDPRAGRVQEILDYWAINEKEKFEEISRELHECLNISLSLVEDEAQVVKVLEEDENEISLSNMSDGTLRLIAYFILLYKADIPTLIGIEEPEQNFHPGILKEVASIIKRLSKRTQLVFTTHSSQLLDCFEPEEISSAISVILLSKKSDSGTKAFLLDKLAENRDDLSDWMTDFGLGSAIYHSHLIEKISTI